MPKLLFPMLVVAALLGVSACSQSEPNADGNAANAAPVGRIAVTVGSDGFSAGPSHVKVGRPVTLVVTRKVEKTCATDLVIAAYGVNQPLPMNQAVEITFTPTKAGPIPYSCAMGMVGGELIAE